MDVYVILSPEGYDGPYKIVGYDGRFAVRLSGPNGDIVADSEMLVSKDETGTYQPVRRKQLQRFRGECG